MKTTHEPKQWAVIGTVAAILLIIWTTALGAKAPVAEVSHKTEADRNQAMSPIFATEELVRLEDTLQWNGKTPVTYPSSQLVTNPLPANC